MLISRVWANWLYVAYARVGPDGHQAVGAGQGFVDIFNPDGTFVERFASRGSLNAPWGVAMAPAGWLTTNDMSDDSNESGDNSGKGSNNSGQGNSNGSGKLNGGHDNDDNVGPVVLIGNFGDGRINVFAPTGQYLGQLQSHSRPIVIDGLWAIGFAPATATTHRSLTVCTFTAGPDHRGDGWGFWLFDQELSVDRSADMYSLPDAFAERFQKRAFFT